MKVLPINNISNINKNHNYKPSFKAGWIDDTNSYERLDSYIDETGMHYVRNRVHFPWNEPWDEQINDGFDERPLQKNPQKIKENVFHTQRRYDNGTPIIYNLSSERAKIRRSLYDLDIEDVGRKLAALSYENQKEIIRQPFFLLGLADIPLTEKNKELYKGILDKVDSTNCPINVIDEHGITLLEKVVNAENELYLETIKSMCKSMNPHHNGDKIAYDSMQKYAFDNIQNPEFKKKCKNLPIKFFDIIDDIERKDLKALDKDIQEQIKCGFCNIQFALKESIYMPATKAGSEYLRMVLDVAQKHFPSEVDRFVNKLTIRF